MKTKYIVLREGYDWLSIGNEESEVTNKEYKSLCMYLKKNNYNKSIVYDYNRLKFINYVGIIVVENLIIEILPKISLTNDIVKDREMLIFMLSKCNKISVDINEMLNSNLIKQPLLEILSKIFSEKLLKELRKGVFSEYVSQEESLNKIKGKLMLTQNIRENAMNKTKVYCKYDEFTENNLFNVILKRAINVVLIMIHNDNLKKELNIVKSIFQDVDDIYIQESIINNYKLNKANERFIECFTLAKMILLNSSMDKSLGKEKGFSILFEMNYLYEEYIGVLLKEVLNDKAVYVNTQEKSEYLLWNIQKERNEVALKPDIIIYKNDKPKIILDTKWKSAVWGEREVYKQNDIYQMYAYITSYIECEKCILLYPKLNNDIEHSVWNLNHIVGDKQILINEINLESYQRTKIDLYDLVN